MNNRSSLFLLSILVLVFFLQGCSKNTAVTFNPHAPYQTQYSTNKPLVILLPTHFDRVYERHVVKSSFFSKDVYRIYFGNALAEEAKARFAKKFSTVSVYSDEQFAIINDSNPRGFEFELKEKEYPKPKEIEEMKRELDFAPSYVGTDEGYILTFSNVDFEYQNDMAFYRFYVEFIDRESNEILFEGNLTGRGSSNYSVTSAYGNKKLIANAVTNAFNNGCLSLSKEIDKSLQSKP